MKIIRISRLVNTALGLLLMGTARSINDLSRGCSAEDFALEDLALITAIITVQSL